MTFCSRHRQTILPKHLPLSLAHQYSSTTSLIRFSVWFLSSILSLSLSLSSANLLHLPLSSTRSPSPSTTVSTFPLSNFSSKSLAFASGSTGSGPTLPWTGFAGVFTCYKHRQKKIVPNFYSRSNDGVCHADELFMLFKPHQVPVTMVRSDVDKRVGESFLNIMSGTS